MTSPAPRIVFFDGVCGLCNHFVDFLLRADRRQRLAYAPLQGTTAAATLPAPLSKGLDTVIYLRDGMLHTRSSAAIRILMDTGGAWRALGILWVIPRPLRDLLYNAVANNRYKWFGKKETCRLPTPAERARFLP